MMRQNIWVLLAAGWVAAFGCSDEDSAEEVVPGTDTGLQDAGGDAGTGTGGVDTGISGEPKTDGDAGPGDTGTGSDLSGACMGVVCRVPPANVCAGNLELSVYNTYGWCDQGDCFYADHSEECLTGPCASGICTDGPCQGVRCDRPPQAECVNDTTVRRYNNIGYCRVDGGSPVCEYASEEVACEGGCAESQCVGEDSCAHVICDAPPARYCAENGDLMVWDTLSRCEEGTCLYSMQPVTCALGCTGGHCEGDLTCKNTLCDSPPAAFCLDGNTLKTFDNSGSCEDGACIYGSRLILCANGCEGGQCVGEPCAGVVCDFKPVPHCANDTSLTYWDGVPGACEEGVCHYGVVTESCPGGCEQGRCIGSPCIGVHCNTPPVSYCAENVFRSFVPDGQCKEGAGTCEYTPIQNNCSDGCEGGLCRSIADTDTDSSDDSDTGTDSDVLSNVLIIGDAGEGGQVLAGDETILTVADNSLPAGSTVTVDDAGYDVVETAGQVFDVITGFDLSVEGTAGISPEISTPNEDGLSQETQILVVEKMDLADGVALNMVGTASVSEDGARIESNNVSDSTRFPGDVGAIRTGVYLLIVTAGDQGFVTGQVTDASGSVVAGQHVHSSSDIFIGVTDTNGYYVIPESFGSRSLFVTNPATGEYGSAFSAVGALDSVADIQLREPPVIAGAGLPSGCLDLPLTDTASGAYTVIGNTQVVPGLDPLVPLQGGGMALMTTGEGAASVRTSGLDVTFSVPAGVSMVNFDYRYLSDEFPDQVDAEDRDLFSVYLFSSEGSLLVFQDQSDDIEMLASETTFSGEKGWRGISVSVLDTAGLEVPVTLSLVVGDVAGTDTDSAVLVDNLRFDDEMCDGEQL